MQHLFSMLYQLNGVRSRDSAEQWDSTQTNKNEVFVIWTGEMCWSRSRLRPHGAPLTGLFFVGMYFYSTDSHTASSSSRCQCFNFLGKKAFWKRMSLMLISKNFMPSFATLDFLVCFALSRLNHGYCFTKSCSVWTSSSPLLTLHSPFK